MKNKNILDTIKANKENCKKMIAVLIDPEKCFERSFAGIVAALKSSPPDFIFVGGSMISDSFDSIIHILKEELNIPIVLFPGDASQLTSEADAVLYLSLLSGRNPEYLIGQHVKSAKNLVNSGLEVIPTSYLLIDGGKRSSVEYLSNTNPIPSDKTDIALSTVLAGQLMGHQLTYLEAGSGALKSVSTEMIQKISHNTKNPLIVGGGIRNIETVAGMLSAGADLLVVGNYIEENPGKTNELVTAVRNFNTACSS